MDILKVDTQKSLNLIKISNSGLKNENTENYKNQNQIERNEILDLNGKPTKQTYQIAVNKLNEFMEHNRKNSKFVFHENLNKYYVEVVDTETQEVVKEIPPKELLDAYYEMQKLARKTFDTQA